MTEKRPGSIYGRRLREARESYGYSQADLVAAIGLDVPSVASNLSRYENGIHQSKPGMQRLFAQALKLPLTYFYTEDDEAARQILAAARSDEPVQKLNEIKSKKGRRRKSRL
ncbi:helix-turn-helix domain-containing protein [[Pseudomonas] boreopolis]|uniref:helix-turn-helix domain-containing protein n=1 Tax=Xanthomonas boreopolis TaxID=86183 RepID=UPI003DA05D17